MPSSALDTYTYHQQLVRRPASSLRSEKPLPNSTVYPIVLRRVPRGIYTYNTDTLFAFSSQPWRRRRDVFAATPEVYYSYDCSWHSLHVLRVYDVRTTRVNTLLKPFIIIFFLRPCRNEFVYFRLCAVVIKILRVCHEPERVYTAYGSIVKNRGGGGEVTIKVSRINIGPIRLSPIHIFLSNTYFSPKYDKT